MLCSILLFRGKWRK